MDAEKRMDLWEDRRAIKNLMGIYSQSLLLKKIPDMFGSFWADREDICIGRNDGWFSGRAAVAEYYAVLDRANIQTRDLLMELYPEQCAGKTAEELYGIGSMEIKSLNNAIVEVAEDRQTAKYFAVCIGLVTRLDETGAVSSWVYSYWCADLVREGEEWKLWHMTELSDIDAPCGTPWGKPEAQTGFDPEPGFEAFAAIPQPVPNVPAALWELYHGGRAFVGTPRLPEPYAAFSQTFSYGPEGGAF